MRKTLFVKPRLQSQYMVISILLAVISGGIVYVTLSHVLFSSIQISSLSPMEVALLQKSFRYSFFWVMILLALAFGLESLFRFHHLIGPIHVIEKVVKAIASGDLTVDFHVRKNDELKDLVRELSAMQESLRNHVRKTKTVCEDFQNRLKIITESAGKNGASPELRKELAAMQEELRSLSADFKI